MQLHVQIQDFEVPPYSIPNLDADMDGANSETFLAFAATEQEEILRKLLGHVLYDQLEVYLLSQEDTGEGEGEGEGAEPVVHFDQLVNGAYYIFRGKTYQWKGLRKALIPYIASRWIEADVEHFTGLGVANSLTENGESVSASRKIAQFYNEFALMVGCYRSQLNSLYGFLKAHRSQFPDWEWTDVLSKNHFGL